MHVGTGITGGNYPAEIWGRYMRAWHDGKPEREYKAPEATRSGRYLELPRNVDGGSVASSPSTTQIPGLPPGFTFPTNISLPPGFTVPTRPNRPTTPTRPNPPPTNGPGGPQFPPGFPFDD